MTQLTFFTRRKLILNLCTFWLNWYPLCNACDVRIVKKRSLPRCAKKLFGVRALTLITRQSFIHENFFSSSSSSSGAASLSNDHLVVNGRYMHTIAQTLYYASPYPILSAKDIAAKPETAISEYIRHAVPASGGPKSILNSLPLALLHRLLIIHFIFTMIIFCGSIRPRVPFDGFMTLTSYCLYWWSCYCRRCLAPFRTVWSNKSYLKLTFLRTWRFFENWRLRIWDDCKEDIFSYYLLINQ